MTKSEVIIIGAGLFGSMTAKYLRKQGLDVLIIDTEKDMAASKCSMGIWKEGWINSIIKAEVEEGMPILDEFCGGIEEVEFMNMDKWEPEVFKWADCSEILNEEFFPAFVQKIGNKQVDVRMTEKDRDSREVEVCLKASKAIIVCAGVWTGKLLQASNYKKNLPSIDRYWGANLNVAMEIDSSRISTWAPYKQNVLFKTSDGEFVFGDGATVKNPKEGDERIDKVSRRLEQHLNEVTGISVPGDKIIKVNQGHRPYLNKNGSGGFINQHDDNLFSATGGAKNSTILCGYIAKQIYERIKGL